jgi:hypothetical protein
MENDTAEVIVFNAGAIYGVPDIAHNNASSSSSIFGTTLVFLVGTRVIDFDIGVVFHEDVLWTRTGTMLSFLSIKGRSTSSLLPPLRAASSSSVSISF